MPEPSQTTSGASKHTPGPWKLTNGTVLGADGIGVTRPIDRFDGAADANARLIAAAPDLLAACESAIETLKRLQADGYLDNGGPSVPGSAEPEWPWYLSKFETDAKAAIAKAKGGVA